MGLPKFPQDPSEMTRDDAINQIISSIAMEELGLSHILNAEGEKLQYVLGTLTGASGLNPTMDELLKVNDSVQQMLNTSMQSQMFLQNKMTSALNSAVMAGPTGPTGATGVLVTENELFSVIGGTGTDAPLPMYIGDKITLTTNTPDLITITVGADNTVNINSILTKPAVSSLPSHPGITMWKDGFGVVTINGIFTEALPDTNMEAVLGVLDSVYLPSQIIKVPCSVINDSSLIGILSTVSLSVDGTLKLDTNIGNGFSYYFTMTYVAAA